MENKQNEPKIEHEQKEEKEVPQHTLYLKNLNDRVKKHELKISLYFLFSQYGDILDIITKKTKKMRGQAFIVFRSVESAEIAKKNLQNFLLFDRPMKIEYSKKKSDVIAIMDGTFKFKDRKKIAEICLQQRKQREDEAKVFEEEEEIKRDVLTNNILMVQNLPEIVTKEMVEALFRQYPGFIEIKLITDRQMAFVEYDDDTQAKMALKGLQGFNMTEDCEIEISYAKLS